MSKLSRLADELVKFVMIMGLGGIVLLGAVLDFFDKGKGK